MNRLSIEGLLAEEGLARVANSLRAMIRPAIRLVMDEPTTDTDFAIGQSKVGGLPDMPPDIPWPTIRVSVPPPTERFRTIVAETPELQLNLPPSDGVVPLTFLGQIRLSDLAGVVPDNPLPSEGHLLFFYNNRHFHSDGGAITGRAGFGDVTLGFNSYYPYGAPDNGRGLYLSAGCLLQRRQAETESGFQLQPEWHPPCTLSFTAIEMLPHLETSWLGAGNEPAELVLTTEEMDFYDEASREVFVNTDHLLGYSQDAQPYAMEASYQHHRSLMFPELPDWKGMTFAERQHEYRDIVLLAQFENQRNGLLLRVLFFVIRQQDLQCRDFSKVWYLIQ